MIAQLYAETNNKMSGGQFEYKEWHIEDIAESIQCILDRQGKEIPKEDRWGDDHTHYETFSEEVQQIMREGVEHLRKAYVYAKRLDYFLSGDSGEESMLERIKFELQKLEELKELKNG